MNQHVIDYLNHNNYYDDLYLEIAMSSKSDVVIKLLKEGFA